jgi:hypothetical protein
MALDINKALNEMEKVIQKSDQKELEQEFKKEIEEIMSRMKCPKDFKCYKSGFKELCKSKDTRVGSFVECLEENYRACIFSQPFENKRFCLCSMRTHIVKKLGK